MKYWRKLINEKIYLLKFDWFLLKRHLSMKWRAIKQAIESNLHGKRDDLIQLGIDLAVVITAAFVGILIGGFLGFILVINALMG